MTTTFTEAVQKHASRQVMPSDRSASEWADVPVGLRDRAFFSARTTHAGYLQKVKDSVESIINPKTVMRDGKPVTEGMNLASARVELRNTLREIGYHPEEGQAGTIKDLSSDGRIDLVLTQNAESAFGYGQFLQGQDPAVLEEWPAQELFRAEDRKEPRAWPTRWMQAGGQIFDGKMIALKSDPIWSAISEFDTPYPPYGYNSGMWVRDVDRITAENLGLLSIDQEVSPSIESFNANLQASVKDIAPDLLDSLKQSFGAQLQIIEGVAKWLSA
jgi:hypothetical protein